MARKFDSDGSRGAAAQRTYYVQGHRVEQHRSHKGHSSWSCDCALDLRLQHRDTSDSCTHQRHVVEALILGRLLRT